MSITDSRNPTLREASLQFLSYLSPEKSEASQAEINKFVRWYGAERSLAKLTAHEIANYAERLSLADTSLCSETVMVRSEYRPLNQAKICHCPIARGPNVLLH